MVQGHRASKWWCRDAQLACVLLAMRELKGIKRMPWDKVTSCSRSLLIIYLETGLEGSEWDSA